MPKTKQEELLEGTYSKVSQIWTAFFGVEGTNDKGMYGDFHHLQSDYYRFKRLVFMIFGVMIGSGIIGFGVSRLIELIG